MVNILNNAVDDKEVTSFVQYAGWAAVEPTEDPDRVRVVLDDVSTTMFAADNAPGRYSDRENVADFLDRWDFLFQSSPPNAALFGVTEDGDLDIYFLTLTDPVYEADQTRLSYTAVLLGGPPDGFRLMNDVFLNIDTTASSRFPFPSKGSCYAAFSRGYDPSTANKTVIYFGSDIGRKQMGSLWGNKSYLSQSCADKCRDDMKTMQNLGINLVRLYDWGPRNDHSQFLNYCQKRDIKVLVSVSNWLPTQNEKIWGEQVPDYFTYGNYANKAGTNWHPAVAGVMISNEPFVNFLDYGKVVALTARFIKEADKRGWNKNVLFGIPLAFIPRGAPFAPNGADMPAWNPFNRLLSDPLMSNYQNRLMLCVNTQNGEPDLYQDMLSTGQGWVQATWDQFKTPIVFTEIGRSRYQKMYSPKFVQRQLKASLKYQKQHPDRLLGICHFQFSDKVWKQSVGDTEGAFGGYTHGDILMEIPCQKSDFSYWLGEPASSYGKLSIDQLVETETHQAVVNAYK